MSNINEIAANQELFTELTNQEGSAIQGGAAVLYEHINGLGDSRSFDAGGYENFQYNNFNDKTSSIYISEGTWELYEHANYQGELRILSPGFYNLTDMGFNDVVSSIKRVA